MLILVSTLTTGTSDASSRSTATSFPSQVTASGPGLTKARVGQKNTFTVNCSNAGQSCLFASMFGPGGPCDLNLKHSGGNIYSVNYSVSEAGRYTLHVKWGDDHIPGNSIISCLIIFHNKYLFLLRPQVHLSLLTQCDAYTSLLF